MKQFVCAGGSPAQTKQLLDVILLSYLSLVTRIFTILTGPWAMDRGISGEELLIPFVTGPIIRLMIRLVIRFVIPPVILMAIMVATIADKYRTSLSGKKHSQRNR